MNSDHNSNDETGLGSRNRSARLLGLWHTTFQRPHHLAAFLIRNGVEVDILCQKSVRSQSPAENLPVNVRSKTRPPSILSRLPLVGWLANGAEANQRHMLAQAFMADSERLRIFFGRPNKVYAEVLSSNPSKFVYDCMDDWSSFSGATKEVDEAERMICDAATRIWVVSQALAEKLNTWQEKIDIVPNGVDFDHFSKVTASRADKLVVYVGAIADWFDFELVNSVARLLPDWRFEICGPLSSRDLPTGLLNCPNINLVGPIPYSSVPTRMANATVGIIPFKLTALIEATSPIKLYEYLAAGTPVVATGMREVLPFRSSGVVSTANEAEEFASAIVSFAGCSSQRCQKLAGLHSWDSIFSDALSRLHPELFHRPG